jgi:catechol 2,3-dioxygenase-like lactoylglutathione lyase family enzyme
LTQAADYGHLNLTAPDTTAAANWYGKHFGGDVGPGETTDRVAFGNILVVFYGREPTAGAGGSGVDHIGFSMPNVAQTMAAIVADGGTSLGDLINFDGMTIGFVEDPWGTKIELIDDPELRGSHHIHLSSPDPEATLSWYAGAVGGEVSKFKGQLDGLFYGDIWLLAAQSKGPVAATKGRSMDHLGWNLDNLDAAAQTLKSQGVHFSMEPRDYHSLRIAFIDGPDGVRIELVQPPVVP